MNTATAAASPRAAFVELEDSLNKLLVGQQPVVQQVLLGLLCAGHVLLEGLPGSAKTRLVRVLAASLQARMGRVQFTPDLLPSDVTGTEVLHQEDGQDRLLFQPGPVFSELLLADEINRAPAKVQAALLEAMEERQVTVAGTSHALPALFMVLATQNPIEQEGTYPLPEAQMDRFLLKIAVPYPDDAAELAILRLVHSEEQGAAIAESSPPGPAVSIDQVMAARAEVHDVHLGENIEHYIVALVMASRHPARCQGALATWIAAGASPRGSIALHRCARARAWLQGKDFVDPDDVRAVLKPVLRHRLVLSWEAQAEGITADMAIDELVRQVAVV